MIALEGITGFVGANGSGKTLALMELLVVPALRAGVPVCSSAELFPAAVGADPRLYIPLTSWRQITRLGVTDDPAESLTGNRPCVLALDEVNALMPSRQTMDMPAELQRMLNQFRKPKVRVGWTAPAWARADKQLREVTSVVVLSRGSWPDRWQRDRFGKKLRDADGKKLRVPAGEWPPNRLFHFDLYDAMSFDEFSLDRSVKVESLAHKAHWRPRGQAMHVYSTRQQVGLLDWIHGGECVNCGGTRRRPACSCPKPAAVPLALPAPASSPMSPSRAAFAVLGG